MHGSHTDSLHWQGTARMVARRRRHTTHESAPRGHPRAVRCERRGVRCSSGRACSGAAGSRTAAGARSTGSGAPPLGRGSVGQAQNGHAPVRPAVRNPIRRRSRWAWRRPAPSSQHRIRPRTRGRLPPVSWHTCACRHMRGCVRARWLVGYGMVRGTPLSRQRTRSCCLSSSSRACSCRRC